VNNPRYAETQRMPRPRRRSGPVRHRFISMSRVIPSRGTFERLEAQCIDRQRQRTMRGIEARLEGRPRPDDRDGAAGWDACDEAVRLGRMRKGTL